MRQVDLILEHFQKGRSLTKLEAIQRYGCGNLGGRVYDLRRAGFPIKTRYKTVKTRHGGKAVVAEYFLDGGKSERDN